MGKKRSTYYGPEFSVLNSRRQDLRDGMRNFSAAEAAAFRARLDDEDERPRRNPGRLKTRPGMSRGETRLTSYASRPRGRH